MPRPSLRLSAALWIALACGTPALARVFHVDPAAPGPARDGATWGTAFATIGDALADAGAGDEVRVAEGQYGENITLREGVALRGGYPGGPDAGGPRDPARRPALLYGDGLEPVVFAPAGLSPASVLEGFEFQTDSEYGVYCVTSSPTIAANVFRQVATGVNCGAGGAPVIVNNRFLFCETGVFSVNASPVIAGNLFLAGLTGARHSGGEVTLVNNTIAWCGTGVYSANGAALVASNILAYNDTGLRGKDGAVSLRCNAVFENRADYEGLSDPTGQNGNVRTDPRFVNVDTDDLRLRPDSPCLDAGDDDAVATITDLDGGPRIWNGRVDIGAYEFVPRPASSIAEALRAAGGLIAVPPGDMPRLDVEQTPPSAGIIDLLDAVRMGKAE